MDAADGVYLPVLFGLVMAMVVCAVYRRYFKAWVLTYVIQGVAVMAAVTYAALADWGDMAPAATLAVAILVNRGQYRRALDRA